MISSFVMGLRAGVGTGFRIWAVLGVGFWISGVGFNGLGFRVQGVRFGVQ